MTALLLVNGALFALLAVAVVFIWFREPIARHFGSGDALGERAELEVARADARVWQRTADRLGALLEHRASSSTPAAAPMGALTRRLLEADAKAAPRTVPNGAAPRIPTTNGATTHTGTRSAAVRGDAKVAAMVAQGVDPEVATMHVERWKPLHDAVAARAGGDVRLARHLRSVADDLFAAGLEPDEIARRILVGDAVE